MKNKDNYPCRNPKGECRCCNIELRKNRLDYQEGVEDYIRYHSTPNYFKHITSAIKALERI